MIRVMIGVPTQEMARRADFYDYLNVLDKPEQTMMTFAHGQSPAKNRNLIIQQALNQECTHILFVDDDVVLPKDSLLKLLEHDVDIVSGLYYMRNFPHRPIIFDSTEMDGSARWHLLKDGEKGLIPIVACGLGAVLIKTDVFKKMEQPWIRLGELELDHWCDDIGFFKRVREAGFKLFCDLNVKCGHMCSMILYPNQIDGKWYTTYDTNGEGTATLAQQSPALVEA